MLSTKDSLILYDLVAPHLPEEPDEDVLKFIGTIIENIVGKEGCTDYVMAVVLLSGKPVEEVVKMDDPAERKA